MPYRQLRIDPADIEPERLEQALFACGAIAVTLEDGADDPVLEPGPGEVLLWPSTRFCALFDEPCDERVTAISLALLLDLDDLPLHRWERLADQPWERLWLNDFKPLRCGERLWICPGGQAAPDPNAVTVQLDPGLAFGTGTHPSTHACLEWLDANPPRGLRVLDYGCGSGILAVAALALGAARATAIDNDPQALIATRENAARNEVGSRIAVALPDGIAALQYDVVIANILCAPLIRLAPVLAACARPGADLVLAGLLAEQAEMVMSAYVPFFEFHAPAFHQEWVRLAATRRIL